MWGLRWNTNEFPREALAARTHGDQGICRLRVRTTFSTDHLSHGVPERKEQRKGDECTAFSTCLPQILMCISNAFGRLCLCCCRPAFLFLLSILLLFFYFFLPCRFLLFYFPFCLHLSFFFFCLYFYCAFFINFFVILFFFISSLCRH